MKKLTLLMLFFAIVMSTVETMAQDLSQSINDHFTQLVETNKLQSQDVQYSITDQNVSTISGVTNAYFRQAINGLQIYGTESAVHILSNGTVISDSNRFIHDAQGKLTGSTSTALTSIQAVQAAASRLNYTITEGISVLEYIGGPSQQVILSDGGISLSAIPAKLMYQLNDNEQLVLVWDISIQEKNQQNWWSMRVDAASGEIVHKNDWMVSCGFEHDHSNDTKELNFNSNLYDIPNYKELSETNAIGCTECYEVIAMPTESPYYGARTTVVQPADLTASPFGWHDTDGVSGAEFTVTKGNNVDAYEDGDNSGFQPDAGASLNFIGYPFSEIYTNANQYESAAITNLFYWNNVFHDVLYQYGFDEAGGNFQENNYGNGGLGSDSVNAEAQDGSGTCNANFGTPTDGNNPTMQMYICNDKDGDFDNLVILHEYGHGVSNRLTGGPNTSGCLSNQEQMGEGWSDYYGVVLTIEPGDTGTDPRGVGTYLFGQGAGGPGIRPFPYSTDLVVNPQTYDDIKTLVAPHGVGSVWATMMWEVTWALIDEYGFSPDLYTFTGDVTLDAGNVQAFALITEGMKLQPCSPGFVDGRDAIFAADIAIYGGANECILWDAFAKRGLGLSADQGSSANKNDGTEAFDTPSGMATFTAPDDVCASSGILTDLGGGTPFGGVYSGPGVTDDGNGSTYSFDPAVAGVGVHTISYEVGAGPCSVASTATDDIEVLAIPDSPTTTGVNDFCPGDSVTVTATLVDPLNVIRWFDAPTGGTFLFEGTSFTFNPTASVTVYAQENPPGPVSQLVISELTLETPDRFEIQNVGAGTDYTDYTVAVSDTPYTNINSINSITQPLGVMAANSVVDYNDSGGAGYWGNNIFWDNSGTGWIVIIDDLGNVVDSVFWNFSAGDIAGFNVVINGFTITAAELDWTGAGASLTMECADSFRRNDDTNDASNWANVCLPSDYGVANADINLGTSGCLADRTPAEVTIDSIDPEITCPADTTETVNTGEMFTIPDYSTGTTATDNCTVSPIITQDPVTGTMVGVGVTVITMTATDEVGNDVTCTFNLTVDEVLGISDQEFSENLVFFPNPTTGTITLLNNSNTVINSVIITDVNGRVVQKHNLQNVDDQITFSFESFAQGMYFIKIEAESTSVIKRIVKQ